MRLHVVSDVHGNTAALPRAADGADGLLVLGDLLEFIDYRTPENGIVGRLLGADVSTEFGRLRRIGAPREQMFRLMEHAWSRFDDPAAAVVEAVSEQYAELFGVLGKLDVPVWAIPGNVDMPEVWPETDGVTAADGQVVTLEGRRLGFLGGVPLPPGLDPRRTGPWRPYFLRHEDYAARLAGLPAVDVLCTHAPPAVPVLAYDVVAHRMEVSSDSLRDRIGAERSAGGTSMGAERSARGTSIGADAPSHALFGHVHQPLVRRARLGRTECVNVGHFRELERPYALVL